MRTICVKTPHGLDLLHAWIILGGEEMEVCGLARQEYVDGLLWQWWILMEKE